MRKIYTIYRAEMRANTSADHIKEKAVEMRLQNGGNKYA